VCKRERKEVLKNLKDSRDSRENITRTGAGDLWKEEIWKIGPQIGQLSEQSYRTSFEVRFPLSPNL
jgi:hypothetical protein